jgi:hypothetical protein
MKLTKQQLKQIIREETSRTLNPPITVLVKRSNVPRAGGGDTGTDQIGVFRYDPGSKEYKRYVAAGVRPGKAIEYDLATESYEELGEAHPVEDLEVTQRIEDYRATEQGRQTRDLTREQLKRIIKEELEVVLSDAEAREFFGDDVLEKETLKEGECPKDGCVQKRDKGWVVISNKTGECWGRSKKGPGAECTYYDSREDAEAALGAYHA